MTAWEALLLLGGGIVAGVINSMAGGGSLLTVPLLSIVGVGGLDANGTNRVAVLVQTLTSGLGFHQEGVRPYRATARLLPSALVGGLVGALVVSSIDDEFFERIFGVLMIPLLALALWKPNKERLAAVADEPGWPWWLSTLVFFAVGFYAGAIQAGVGILLLLTLSRSGIDLLRGNAIKTLVVIAITAVVALPVFVVKGQVEWAPAAVLSIGTGVGGYLGARVAARGGDRVIKPVLVVAVIGLAGRMVGLY